MPPKSTSAKIIKIDDSHRIEIDAYNYTLKVRSVVQDEESSRFGEIVWNIAGHYGSLGGALYGAVTKLVLDEVTITKIERYTEVFRDIAMKYERLYAQERAKELQAALDKHKNDPEAPVHVSVAYDMARLEKAQKAASKPKRNPSYGKGEEPPLKKKMKKVKKRRNPSRF